MAPTGISHFPGDLANPGLEFSGIYEDGWLGDEGFAVLSADRPGNVVFRGLFPMGLGLDGVDLTLTVKGAKPVTKHLAPGPFAITAPAGRGSSRIDFKFSAIGRLPSGDNRPATALLSSISIEPDDGTSLGDQMQNILPKVIQGVATEADGVLTDGWLARNAFVVVNSTQPGKVMLGGMVPGGIGLDDQEVVITTQVGEEVRKKLGTGPFEIEIPVPRGRSKLSMAFSQEANLPQGDGRSAAALLSSIKVVPLSQ